MNKKAVLNQLKQIKIPLPGLFIVIVWLMISYLLYPHKIQKPEVKGISDSRVIQIKPSPTIMPTPKASKTMFAHPSETPIPTVYQANVNSSALSQNDPSTNNSNNVSPTQVPSLSNTPEVENIPTNTPTPSINETETTITPGPTVTQPSNENNTPNNTPVDNGLATTVKTLSQVLLH